MGHPDNLGLKDIFSSLWTILTKFRHFGPKISAYLFGTPVLTGMGFPTPCVSWGSDFDAEYHDAVIVR